MTELYVGSPLCVLECEPGVLVPAGARGLVDLCWDGDVVFFKTRRFAGIACGRVNMLVTKGSIMSEVVGKFPGYSSQLEGLAVEDILNGLFAIFRALVFGRILFVVYGLYGEASRLRFNYACRREVAIGNVGWKSPLPRGLAGEAHMGKLNIDIARLARAAFIGAIYQDVLIGSAWGDWGSSQTPRRAPPKTSLPRSHWWFSGTFSASRRTAAP